MFDQSDRQRPRNLASAIAGSVIDHNDFHFSECCAVFLYGGDGVRQRSFFVAGRNQDTDRGLRNAHRRRLTRSEIGNSGQEQRTELRPSIARHTASVWLGLCRLMRTSSASPLFSRLRRSSLLITALLMVALKLWLVAAQPVVAHANASFDDRLFLALAEQILKGKWLGPYSQFTLMKGPMYSLFIAATVLVRIPLPLAQHLLYLFGCALLTVALRPLFSASWQAFALFILLWWQPMSYVELDILRQNIYTPLTLLLFAGLCALETRRNATAQVRLLWGVLLGTSAGAFYLTREEGVWIVPGAALLIASAFWNSW